MTNIQVPRNVVDLWNQSFVDVIEWLEEEGKIGQNEAVESVQLEIIAGQGVVVTGLNTTDVKKDDPKTTYD